MKKLCALAILTVFASASTVFATSFTVSTVGGYGPHQTGQGGEFTLQTSDAFMDGIASGYSSETKDQVPGHVNFQSFCVEGPEHIYGNKSYDVVFSDRTTTGNYLTKGAAFLYSQFAQGTLFGYNYELGRTTSADQLQKAIWALMGGQQSQTFNLLNPFESLVTTQFTDWNTANEVAGTGDFGVSILNMWDAGFVGDSSHSRQDQLIWRVSSVPDAPVRDAGATALLMVFSVGALALVSKFKMPATSDKLVS